MKIKRNDTFNNVSINRFCGSRSRVTNVSWGPLNGVHCPLCGAPFIEEELQNWRKNASKCRGGSLAKLINNVFGEQANDTRYKRILDRMYEALSNRKNGGNLNIVEAFKNAQNSIDTEIYTGFRDQLSQNIHALKEVKESSSSQNDLLEKCLGVMKELQEALNTHNFSSFRKIETNVRECLLNAPEEEWGNIWPLIRQNCFLNKMSVVDAYNFISKWANHRSPQKISNSFAQAYSSSAEHVVAASRGGEWCITNYIPLHSFCNTEKGNISWPQLFRLGLTNKDRVEDCIQQMEPIWDEVVVKHSKKPSFDEWSRSIQIAIDRDP